VVLVPGAGEGVNVAAVDVRMDAENETMKSLEVRRIVALVTTRFLSGEGRTTSLSRSRSPSLSLSLTYYKVHGAASCNSIKARSK
jgi:hypothetical protein